MKNITKIIAVLLMAAMAVTLCACSSDNGASDETTNVETTVAETTEAETTEAANEPTFTVTVVDDAGNAVSDVIVQVCDDSNCFPSKTDAEGKAFFYAHQFTEITSAHTLTLLTVPEGFTYEYTGGNKLSLESGITEYTVTLVTAG